MTLPFSEDHQRIVRQVACRIFEGIAHDLFEAARSVGEDPDPEDIFDFVADRMRYTTPDDGSEEERKVSEMYASQIFSLKSPEERASYDRFKKIVIGEIRRYV